MRKKRLFYTWEMGDGLGHLTAMKDDIESLNGEFDCFVAVKDLKHASRLFKHLPCTLLQAPMLPHKENIYALKAKSYAYVLADNGYLQPDVLTGLIDAWTSLLNFIKPDVVIYEHSPTAILASKGYDFKKINRGTGFTCPPIESPLGVFLPDQLTDNSLKEIKDLESQVLQTINTVLTNRQLAPLNHLSDLYTIPDQTDIMAPERFDQFNRKDKLQVNYAGIREPMDAQKPEWPLASGKRIFAYSHYFQHYGTLLSALNSCKQPTIVYSNSTQVASYRELLGNTVRVTNQPVSITQTAKECDFAITNANMNVTSQLLKAGVPLLVIPLHLEQRMFAQKIKELGVCEVADPEDKNSILAGLHAVANNDKYKKNALELSAELNRHKFRTLKETIECLGSDE